MSESNSNQSIDYPDEPARRGAGMFLRFREQARRQRARAIERRHDDAAFHRYEREREARERDEQLEDASNSGAQRQQHPSEGESSFGQDSNDMTGRTDSLRKRISNIHDKDKFN